MIFSLLCSSDIYRGASVASEAETKTMLAFHDDKNFEKACKSATLASSAQPLPKLTGTHNPQLATSPQRTNHTHAQLYTHAHKRANSRTIHEHSHVYESVIPISHMSHTRTHFYK
jgi:hypothetical protein